MVRWLLGQPIAMPAVTESTYNGIERDKPCFVCAHCGAAMIILQTFTRGPLIRAPPQHVRTP